MENTICFILLLTAYTRITECAMEEDLGYIEYTTIMYRHGIRAPVRAYPNDPYRNMSHWPNDWGELTQEGMREQFELGKWLRQRYSQLLPMGYHRDDIHVQSTNVDRVLMSALCNLAGLYEPNPSKNWNKKIRWRPIPVHTTPESQDKLSGKRYCPYYFELERQLLVTPKIARILENFKPDIEALSAATGSPITRLQDIIVLYDTLYVEKYYGLTLPEWSKHFYPQPLQSMAEFSVSVPAYTPEMARLISGPILSDVVHRMENKIVEKSGVRAWVYAGHDSTLANFMQAMGVFDGKIPPFDSAIMVELRKRDGHPFVTVFYKNTTQGEPHLLTVPGCSSLCPWEQFKALMRPVIPTNWRLECANGRQNLQDTPTRKMYSTSHVRISNWRDTLT